MRLCLITVCAALAPLWAAPEDLARGTVIEHLVCRGKETQSYALYIPKAYAPEKMWPILYCLDPGARGHIPVERFAEAAEKTGFILAGSNNSRNGPMEPVREAIFWMVADTHERLSIDDKRLYAAGFSGGARVALNWGMNGKLAGIAVCGAGFGAKIPEKVPFAIYAAAGADDFNYHELYALSRELARQGMSNRFAEFDGGHMWMPPALALDALEFFAGRVPSLPAPQSDQEERQFEQYEQLMDKVQQSDYSAKKDILESLKKRADKPADSSDRRVVRRVLGGTFIGAIEAARPLMEKKQYSQAAKAWELALAAAQTDAPGVWFSLAVAFAGTGDKKRSLNALEQALKQGFRDRSRIIDEPLFAPFRGDPRFAATLKSLEQ